MPPSLYVVRWPPRACISSFRCSDGISPDRSGRSCVTRGEQCCSAGVVHRNGSERLILSTYTSTDARCNTWSCREISRHGHPRSLHCCLVPRIFWRYARKQECHWIPAAPGCDLHPQVSSGAKDTWLPWSAMALCRSSGVPSVRKQQINTVCLPT